MSYELHVQQNQTHPQCSHWVFSVHALFTRYGWQSLSSPLLFHSANWKHEAPPPSPWPVKPQGSKGEHVRIKAVVCVKWRLQSSGSCTLIKWDNPCPKTFYSHDYFFTVKAEVVEELKLAWQWNSESWGTIWKKDTRSCLGAPPKPFDKHMGLMYFLSNRNGYSQCF